MSKKDIRTLSYNVAMDFVKTKRIYKGKHKITNYTWLKLLPNNNIELHWHDDAVAEIRPDNKVILKVSPSQWRDRAKKFFNILNAGVDPAGQRVYCVGWTVYQSKWNTGASKKFVFEQGTVIDPIDFKLVKGRYAATEHQDKDKAKAWRVKILHFLKACRTFAKLGVVERAIINRVPGQSSWTEAKEPDIDKMYYHIENDNPVEFIQECIETAGFYDVRNNKDDIYQILSPSYNRFAKRLKRRADVLIVVPGAYYVDDREQEAEKGRVGSKQSDVSENVPA